VGWQNGKEISVQSMLSASGSLLPVPPSRPVVSGIGELRPRDVTALFAVL
jgi:hypothetical protein